MSDNKKVEMLTTTELIKLLDSLISMISGFSGDLGEFVTSFSISEFIIVEDASKSMTSWGSYVHEEVNSQLVISAFIVKYGHENLAIFHKLIDDARVKKPP